MPRPSTARRFRWLAVAAFAVGIGVGLNAAVRRVRDAASHMTDT